MNCDSARTEIIAYLKDELEAGKRKRLEEHFAKCPECRKELEKAQRLLTWTEAASDEAIIKSVDDIINQAIDSAASDIHFEPQRDNSLTVRHRIDGVLHEKWHISAINRHGVIARVKLLADMNVAETSLPQDGRIRWSFQGKDFDLRANCMPYVYGDGIVLRILDKTNVLIGLDKLGFYPEHMQEIDRLLGAPNGLLLVVGPTGCGKTTTMYSILGTLVHSVRKVMSIEDPVEYALPGVNQVQVNKRTGLTFEAALRAFLRHDPDIIMVGETRNLETGQIAIEAALTGHLVLSQLHADDAPSAITRLLDMGIEPYLIAATLIGVLAQRLARKVCPNCGEEAEIELESPAAKCLGITALDLNEHKMRRGKGCETCRNTGYKGRTGIYELLTIGHELRAIIANGGTGPEVAEAARELGFADMRHDAKRKVLDGITTPEEALRVVRF